MQDEQKKEDLKDQNAGSDAGTGQPDKKEQGAAEDKVTLEKTEYDKLVEERNNYRTGLLNKKSEEREFKKQEAPADAGAGAGQSQGVSEERLKEIAKEQSQSVFSEIQRANEKSAQRRFLKDNPEYVDDAQWNNLMSHYTGRRGKATQEDVLEDLSDAILLEKKATGKLEEYFKRKSPKEDNQTDVLASAGGRGDSQEQGKTKGLTPESREMAGKFGNAPEKVQAVSSTIDVRNKK